MASNVKWVRLGDYIIQRREKNDSNELPIYGVTRDGFIPPKQKDADTSKYNVFYLNDFVFNPARMEINSIYLNDFCPKAICSSLYEIFYIKDTNVLLPLFLHLFLKRDEFARHCEYIGWGSAREYCRVGDISDIEIPLPSLSEQHKVVNVWKACREIKEQNEAKAAPLMQLCQSYIQELKHKIKSTYRIGMAIQVQDQTNSDNKTLEVLGLNRDKEFMPTVANLESVSLKKYKVISKGQFAFSGMQTGRDVCIRISLYEKDNPALISPAYTTFTLNENEPILPEYLMLLFKNSEMDRLGWFYSDSSVRSNLDWNRFIDIEIPYIPYHVQRAIVDIYKCANEAKQIAAEADKLSKEVCPALLQHIINN
jgi:type I restriction enzyme S subunit